jgi:hypothetical protein
MPFAAPLALLFLGLFIPVILLYLLKQRRRRIEVSTLMFWDKILRDEQTVTSLSKLKKLLSLLLQLLFIALLAFAIARPLLSGKLTGARRIILFVDISASMLVQEGNQTRFDLARQKAASVVRGMSIGDSLMLVAVAAEPDIVHPFTDNKRDLRDAIAKLSPTHGETHFKPAFKIIEELPEDERETHVYLISDGAFDPVEIQPPPRTQFAFIPIGAQSDNIGISAFQVRPLPSSARDFQVHLEVLNDTKDERIVPVELRIGERLLDAYEIKIPPGKSVTRTLRQFSGQGGEVEVVLDVKDAFPLDNRAYAVLPKPRPIKVRLVTEANLFLERALATDDGVELEFIQPKDFTEATMADVTVFSGWHPTRTPAGTSIFIGSWPDDLGLVKRGEIAKPLFTDWEHGHPINSHLALQNVSIEKATAVEPNAKFQTLAASFNDPLVLLREEAAQKVLVITFDTLTTDLPLRVAFPIMIANAVRYLQGNDPGERWLNPPIGAILTRAELMKYLPPNFSTTSNILQRVLDPQGRPFSTVAENDLLPVAKAGFYRVETASDVSVALFAANLTSQNESRIKPSATLPLRSKEPLPELKEGFRLGFEPWFFLVVSALLLSTVEWGLFHRRVIE